MSHKSITSLLIETFLIVFSVILALGLNELRTHINEQKELSEAMQSIVIELNANKKILDEYIPYHGELLDNLEVAIHSDSVQHQLFTENGIAFGRLAAKGLLQQFPTATAWETFKTNGMAARLGYEELFVLTKTYNQQSWTFELTTKIVDLLFSRQAMERKELKVTLMIMRNYLQEFRGRELLLLDYYNEALNKINTES